MAYYVGVDLGATNVRSVVADAQGEVVGSARRSTPTGPSGIAVTEAVLATIREACSDADVQPHRITAAGIASIGPLDLAAGTVEQPANLPDSIDRIPLTGPVENLVDSEDVFLHNDTIAGLIGERFYGPRTPDDVVYLTMSTGIGAGVAVDGNVLNGWDGNAGEVGHMTLDPHGHMTCGCGSPGHWEAYCSGNNIPRYAQHLAEREDISTDLPMADLRAEDVFADQTDPLAHRTLERVADWNTQGIANVCHAYAPIVVYLGGSVALHNPDTILDPIRERLDDHLLVNVPDVELTTLGDEVVVKGALASALTGGTGERRRHS
ncbi:ROK family protein [Halomarina oriensis]|uniref:ROK family protein n=1 Tax=Halomarina oriensis TaxID=671145 RepID=A0A6B0GNL9_9EURY|nr:ROK family protein [Halomarina oriensis]MWG35551.1 ROK family protein [Halomarina oriensis]